MKEADIAPLTLGDPLRYLCLWIFMSTCSGCKRGGGVGVGVSHPLIKNQIHAPTSSVNAICED